MSVQREKVRFVSGASECAAWHYPGTNGGCVIMAGGFAVTKEPATDKFAQRFSDAGYTVLAFDYRRLGDSGGLPRLVQPVRDMLADWQAAIEFAPTLPGVRAERLAIWSFSASGGHIFRLAAIYGPGRSPFAALRAGTATRVDKRGQVFSRIHVEDLAQVLRASIAQPRPGAVYNVCDDEPAPPERVVAYAAALLGLPPPPLLPFAAAKLSPMARSFYDDNKRVRNRLIKTELGVVLRHPGYQSGLAAILREETCPKSRHPAWSGDK